MTRPGWSLILLLAIAALAPVGDGGTGNLAVAALHTAVLLAATLALGIRAEGDRRRPAVLWLAALFVAWCAGTALGAEYRFAALMAVWELIVAWLVLATSRRLDGGERRLPGVLMLAGMAQAGIALVQYGLGDGTRPTGTFRSPNHLAAYLNLAAALALGRLLSRRGRDPLAATTLAVILAAQVFVVASRGALGGLLIAGLVAAWLERGRIRAALAGHAPGRRLAWAGLALAVVVCGLGAFGLARRFAGPEDVYRHARVRMWPASFQAVVEAPWSGTGRGMFEHVADRYNFPDPSGPVRYGRHFSTTHSQYLEVLVETGVPGLFFFLGAGLAGAAGILARRRESDPDGFRTGSWIGLVALAAQGVGEPLLVTPGVSLPALVIAGAALSPAGRRRLQASGRAAGLRLAAWGVGLGVYCLAVIAPFLGDLHFGRMIRAADGETFRRELTLSLRFNPLQPYYYSRAARTLLDAAPRLGPASYRTCYDYAATAVRLNPLDRRLLLLRAEVGRRSFEEIFRDAASLEETLESYAAAVRAAPTDPIPAAAMSGFLLDLDRNEAALQAAELALSIEPSFVRAWRMRIEALRRLGRAAEAASSRQQLAELLAGLEGYLPRNGYEARILDREGTDADRG